jgi:hypothetical protein
MNIISVSARTAMIVLVATMPLLASAPVPVPEPSTMLLMGGGLAALILVARKKRAGK